MKNKTLKILALAAGIPLLTGGCHNAPDILLFDGVIDGQHVKYFQGDWNSPDRIEICLNAEGNLNEIIEDYNEDEIIGNSIYDKYILYDERGETFYSRDLIIGSDGIEYRSADSDPISKRALAIGKEKLEEVTVRYQDFKRKIELELESRLK